MLHMENFKLLPSPAIFDFALNQTPLDLSKKKLFLIQRETELINQIRDLSFELSSIQSSISNIDNLNEFNLWVHKIERGLR